MRLSYLVLAEKIILDHEDLSPSAINIIDTLDIYASDDAPQTVPPGSTVRVPFVLLLTWEAENASESSEPQPYELLLHTAREIKSLANLQADFHGRTRVHNRLNIPEIPLDGSGPYRFEVRYRSAGQPRSGFWDFRLTLHRGAPPAAS